MKVSALLEALSGRRQGAGPPDHVGHRDLRVAPGAGAGHQPGRRAHRALLPLTRRRWGSARRGFRRLTVLAGPTAVGKGTVSARHPGALPRGVAVGVGDDPGARARARSTGVHYYFVTDAGVRPHGRRRRAAGVGRRPRPNRYGTPRVRRSSRRSPRAGRRCSRSTSGCPAGARADARGAVRLPGPAVLGGTGAPAGRARHRGRPSERARGWRPRGSELAAEIGVRRDHRQRRCRTRRRRTRTALHRGLRPRRSGAGTPSAPAQKGDCVSGTVAHPEGITNPPDRRAAREAATRSTRW